MKCNIIEMKNTFELSSKDEYSVRTVHDNFNFLHTEMAYRHISALIGSKGAQVRGTQAFGGTNIA